MGRTQTILVVVALLAAPLALLSRGNLQASSDCDQFCCLLHGSHSSQAHEPTHDGMSCNHGAAGHMLMCSMKSGHHRMDYGLNSPIVPATPSSIAAIAPPNVSWPVFTPHAEFFASGFSSPPFEPPKL
jgi:hypothetical protein